MVVAAGAGWRRGVRSVAVHEDEGKLNVRVLKSECKRRRTKNYRVQRTAALAQHIAFEFKGLRVNASVR